MKKVVQTVLTIIIFVSLIPAFFLFATGVGFTIAGYLTNPKVMVAIVIVLGIISLPGIIIGWLTNIIGKK